MKRAIVRLIAVLVGVTTGLSALVSIIAISRRAQHSAIGNSGNIDVAALFAIIAVLLLFIAIGLFKFRRWALVTTIIFTGLCSVYSLTRVFVMKPGTNQSGTLFVLVGGVGVGLLLIYAAPRSSDSPTIPGSRPAGVNAVAIVGFVFVPLSVFSNLRGDSNSSARMAASQCGFQYVVLCRALVGALETQGVGSSSRRVTGFLAPLGVLPLLLGTSRHRPFIITMALQHWSMRLGQSGISEDPRSSGHLPVRSR